MNFKKIFSSYFLGSYAISSVVTCHSAAQLNENKSEINLMTNEQTILAYDKKRRLFIDATADLFKKDNFNEFSKKNFVSRLNDLVELIEYFKEIKLSELDAHCLKIARERYLKFVEHVCEVFPEWLLKKEIIVLDDESAAEESVPAECREAFDFMKNELSRAESAKKKK